MRAEPRYRAAESATIFIELEAAQIDCFVATLDRMILKRGATAALIAVESADDAADAVAGALM